MQHQLVWHSETSIEINLHLFMINLIPNEEKKKIAHHFYLRLTVLSFLMGSFVIGSAVFALLPSYIWSRTKEDIVEQKLITQKAEPVPVLDQTTSDAIDRLDAKLTLIESLQGDKFGVTERVINEIIKSKVSGIKILRISYENDGTTGKKISISGEAPSREQLLLFREALENNTAFKNVDLPISNFVKGSNIEFSLKLLPS